MSRFIERDCGQGLTAQIANGATQTTSGIEISRFSSGAALFPAAMAGKTVSFQGALTATGTYSDIYDELGVKVTVVAVSAVWHQLHPAVLCLPFIKVSVDSAVGSNADISFSFKT